MSTLINDLVVNLKSGWKLCLFRKLTSDDFRLSVTQIFALCVVNIVTGLLMDYLSSLPDPQFNKYAVTYAVFNLTALVFAAFMVASFILRRDVMVAISILLLSASPFVFVIQSVIDSPAIHNILPIPYYWMTITHSVWGLAIVYWCLYTIAQNILWKQGTVFIIMLLCWQIPIKQFSGNTVYWYQVDTDETKAEYAAYRDIDAERLLFNQSSLLKNTLSNLAPERSGVVDLYFVGVGAYAQQNVFLKETHYAQSVFDKRFDTAGRSLTLINNLATYSAAPLATSTNIEETLQYLGTVMNPEEDILVLYITSHGSSDHELSFDFWPLPLNDVTPDMLKQYLDKAGIKWRVIMISACYSGGFVEPLKTPYSAIATAAAHDRTSFGCSNENDFTYFGEALLKDQLQFEYSIPVAFTNTTKAITKREANEKLNHSYPQVYIGESIRPVLDKLTAELKQHNDNLLVKNTKSYD